MRQSIYMVFDDKVKGFSMPFASASDAAAVRTFGDAVKQEGSLLSRHPEDFSLCRICDFDDGTGLVNALPKGPEMVCAGRSLVKEA